QPDAGNRLARDVRHLPELLAGLAQPAPEAVGVLLRPAGLAREIGLDEHLRLGADLAARVDEQRADALRAEVDDEDVLFCGHGGSRGVGSRVCGHCNADLAAMQGEVSPQMARIARRGKSLGLCVLVLLAVPA